MPIRLQVTYFYNLNTSRLSYKRPSTPMTCSIDVPISLSIN